MPVSAPGSLVFSMPTRSRARRPAMYNTPSIRSGGFGALQVEAVTNRPMSIQRRHLAASQLRMRDIEPDELSQSEWVRFLVMEGRERERWMTDFTRRRSSTASSSSNISTDADREVAHDKAEEARLEAQEARAQETTAMQPDTRRSPPASAGHGQTPFVSLYARHMDDIENGTLPPLRILHPRRAVDDVEAPPAYNSIIPPNEAPPAYDTPAYEPRSDDEGGSSPRSRSRDRLRQYLTRF
ncbi:hypothetical protein AC579_5234 [Pseudocercospora musae]|uniref:Uncharacterized protein n=1 Tax=Pseudocercospora musae TaxID=113226 RepID=A0A139IPU3_9PEZI|nr:hypothetical protein AC579_5234 [Pseudocercospora musae]